MTCSSCPGISPGTCGPSCHGSATAIDPAGDEDDERLRVVMQLMKLARVRRRLVYP